MSRIGSRLNLRGIRRLTISIKCVGDALGLLALDEVEIGFVLPVGQLGHEPLVDAVGVGDDAAVGGLAEHLGQPRHGRHAAVR